MVEPLLSGAEPAEAIPQDDVEYVRDLGLLRRRGPIAIANPIYQEVIPRDLTYTTQEYLAQDPAWYVDADGRLRLADLLTAFQAFFREHSEHWVEWFQYKEAGPQLLLQAFLQRIVNSGGRIEREYGLGRMRTDLLILWPVARQRPARSSGSEGGDRMQTALQEPGADRARGARTDPRLYGSLRRERRPPRGL